MPSAREALTAFDWWSGIVLPSVTGVATVVLATAALIVSVRAFRQSNRAVQQTARRERAIEAGRLQHLLAITAKALNEESPWSALMEVSDALSEFDRADRQGAKSVAEQLRTWLLHQIEPEGMDKMLKNWVMVDIWTRTLDGIGRYLKDDTEQWRLERLSAQDARERHAGRASGVDYGT